MTGSCCRNGNAAGFDRHDLIWIGIRKQAMKFFTKFVDQFHIDLMIQKSVYLQYLSGEERTGTSPIM